MKKIIFLFFSTLLAAYCFSQSNGYIVTTEKDTIRGIIKTIRSNRVTIEVNGESKKYTISNILDCVMGDEVYKKMEVGDKDPFLAKLILKGKIDLYKGDISLAPTRDAFGGSQFGNSKTVYFAKLGDGIVQIYKGTYDQFTVWVRDYTCDSPLLKGKINWKQIEKVVEEYNRCMK